MPAGAQSHVDRVSAGVPFPRGLAMVDGDLMVLARGRVRSSGGVSAAVMDRAGTLFAIDPSVNEPWAPGEAGEAVRANARVVAEPTDPPMMLWDRASNPPESDTRTDRPYCTLRYHEPTRSLYLCAFSGIDLAKKGADGSSFSKNFTDAVLRYDLRTSRWYDVERHDSAAGATYPHHDATTAPPPHGWAKGPDNCLPLGDWLYVVAKDNSVLIRYDLRPLVENPEAGAPPSEVVMGSDVEVDGQGTMSLLGHSALAERDGWLYVAFRTTSEIVRVPLDDDMTLRQPVRAELLARFDPWDRATGRTADLTDIAFDDDGRLYVMSAYPARVFRFTPDPTDVFDAREGAREPWIDLAARTQNPKMKCENLMPHGDWVYVTSGDGYGWQAGADGTVYRVSIDD